MRNAMHPFSLSIRLRRVVDVMSGPWSTQPVKRSVGPGIRSDLNVDDKHLLSSIDDG